MNLNLKNKNALITGATHGIGKQIALSLANEGCNIAICGRNEERLELMRNELKLKNIDYICIKADIEKEKEINFFLDEVQKKFCSVDIVVNNVGGGGSWGNETPDSTDIKIWDEVYNKNVRTAIKCSMKFLPKMMEREFGRIITISSIAGVEIMGRVWFNIAKTAEVILMKNLSSYCDYSSKNITFNAVAPGHVIIEGTWWDNFRKNNPEKFKKIENAHPRRKFVIVEEIANVVLFLCSNLSSGINGECICVDGGKVRVI